MHGEKLKTILHDLGGDRMTPKEATCALIRIVIAMDKEADDADASKPAKGTLATHAVHSHGGKSGEAK